ncbi:MAG: hypothetical protein P8X82_02495, partial [Gemmatimonadales bacterium]
MIVHKILSLATAGCLIALLVACTGQSTATELAFAVSFTESLDMESLDGRIILIVTDRQEPEPRFQVSAGIDAAQVFGLDVEAFESDSTAVIGSDVLGFPLENLAAIPPGDYYVQAVLHKYETFTLANGKTVKLPMDRGEGQRWNRAPGNLYSTPQKIRVDPTRDGNISIELDQVISPIPEPEDTKYVKHIRIQSDLLTEFWGRPMHLGAHVLLPEGFDRHPNARYPLLIFHGH